MLKHFLLLEWRSFFRAASFRSGMFLRIVMILAALYFIGIFTLMGIGLYFILQKMEMDPFLTVNRFIIYYLIADLLVRFFLQNTPVMNIRSLLTLNTTKNQIVGYSLGKTVLSFFNWLHIFFLLPFTIVLMREGLNPVGAIGWFFGIFALIFANNFLNILSDNNKVLLYGLGLILVSAGILHYLGIFDPTVYTEPLFNALYTSPVYALIPVLVLCLLAYLTFMFFRNHLYLDSGLSIKQKDAQTENYSWLNQFGTLGTFLKNDIKLIKRNKRSRTTILMS